MTAMSLTPGPGAANAVRPRLVDPLNPVALAASTMTDAGTRGFVADLLRAEEVLASDVRRLGAALDAWLVPLSEIEKVRAEREASVSALQGIALFLDSNGLRELIGEVS